MAVSKQNLGLIKEALADYEKLYAAEKSVYHLYQMSTLQYQLKRYGECVVSLDQILASADAEKQKVNTKTRAFFHLPGGHLLYWGLAFPPRHPPSKHCR